MMSIILFCLMIWWLSLLWRFFTIPFLTVVDKALAVIEKSQFYSYKPSVFVLKAKYELLHKGNKKEAAENYNKAIMFASVLEDSVLEESIKAGKAADGL